MEFRILGPLEVIDGTAPVALGGRKQRALVARLLLDANRTVAVDRLVDDLWGDDVPDTAAKMVQIAVSRLRAEGRAALAAGDAEVAAERGRYALALWRGRALEEFPEPFAQGEAAHL